MEIVQVIDNTVSCPGCHANMVTEIEELDESESHMVCLVCGEHFLANLSE